MLVNRLTKRLRAAFPDIPIIARARDTAQAATLYKAGASQAVPEAVEASLQIAEAVLVDLGVAMGPVIACDPREARRASRADQGRGGIGRSAAAWRPAAQGRGLRQNRRMFANVRGDEVTCRLLGLPKGLIFNGGKEPEQALGLA